MGTNLHAFVEIDYADGRPPFSERGQIFSVTDGSFDPDRNYEAMDALAGGRELQMAREDRDPKTVPLISPRGMPNLRSPQVAEAYFFIVASPSNVPDPYFWRQHRCVSQDVADEWVRSKGSIRSTEIQDFNLPRAKDGSTPENLSWQVVSDPAFHTASWLTLEEFDASLRHHDLNLAELPVGYAIIRSAMSLVAERRGTDRVRLIVWFD